MTINDYSPFTNKMATVSADNDYWQLTREIYYCSEKKINEWIMKLISLQSFKHTPQPSINQEVDKQRWKGGERDKKKKRKQKVDGEYKKAKENK